VINFEALNLETAGWDGPLLFYGSLALSIVGVGRPYNNRPNHYSLRSPDVPPNRSYILRAGPGASFDEMEESGRWMSEFVIQCDVPERLLIIR
jgi:hypothetical protein